jgi:uncharacterized protein (DUF1330 family)
VPLTICVMLWARPGQEVLLAEYEDRVLERLGDHGARTLSRVQALEGGPTEVQVLEFPSESALDAFIGDAQRAALADMRNQAVERTEIVRVRPVVR